MPYLGIVSRRIAFRSSTTRCRPGSNMISPLASLVSLPSASLPSARLPTPRFHSIIHHLHQSAPLGLNFPFFPDVLPSSGCCYPRWTCGVLIRRITLLWSLSCILLRTCYPPPLFLLLSRLPYFGCPSRPYVRLSHYVVHTWKPSVPKHSVRDWKPTSKGTSSG